MAYPSRGNLFKFRKVVIIFSFFGIHLTNLKAASFQQVSRVTVRAKAAVEAAGGSVRRVHYNKLGLRALLKPEWFEKKGRLLPKAARPPPKLKDKVDSIGRLPAPRKPIPFTPEENEAMPSS